MEWEIPVIYAVTGKVKIKADTLAEAMEIARDEDEKLPLPNAVDYVSDSWRLAIDNEKMIRDVYNNNQPDKSEREEEKRWIPIRI